MFFIISFDENRKIQFNQKNSNMTTAEETKHMKRLLQTVGKKTFIKYYYYFRDYTTYDEMIKVFKKNGETWNENSCSVKVSNGKAIFKKEYEIEALYFIINGANENKIGMDTKIRAEKLYSELIKDAESSDI